VQAEAAGASLSGRARAAERVAEILRMIANPFEFDLLARKAADFLGVSEELLRKEAQKGRGVNQSNQRTTGAPPTPIRQPFGEGVVPQPEIGMVAIALLHPTLRGKIFESQVFEYFDNLVLSQVLLDVCQSLETIDKLTPLITARLDAEQMDRLVSAIAVFDGRRGGTDPELPKSKIKEFQDFLDKSAGHGGRGADEFFINCERYVTDCIKRLSERKPESRDNVPEY
jgi:DNA primase